MTIEERQAAIERDIDNKEQFRRTLLGDSWYEQLKVEFHEDYMKQLLNVLREEYNNFQIAPAKKDIFRAFTTCPYDKVKVVIVGQDPYPNYYANGVAFATDQPNNPPSLGQIFKELTRTAEIPVVPRDRGLKYLTDQGVMLLNTRLTTRFNQPRSHANIGWEMFIATVINMLANKGGIPFITIGRDAMNVVPDNFNLRRHKSKRFHAEHPAYAIRMKRDWHCNNVFTDVNQFLEANDKTIINW